LRLDSHVCLSTNHPPAHLQAILARNKFDGAVFIVDAAAPPSLEPPISGFVARGPFDAKALDAWHRHPGFRGVCCSLSSGPPAAIEELASRGTPLDLEMRTTDFPALLELAGRLPNLRIVIDHMARPDFGAGMSDEWARGMESAARLPNVFCKISGLLTESDLPWSAAPIRPFVQHALATFGPSRLMYGSEWPVRLPEVIWKESLAAFTQSIGAQPIEVREQLLGGTARAFYGIPEADPGIPHP
jgi:L-fuconolactonase